MQPHMLVRKAVLGFQPYQAGKPIEQVKRELGLREVIKLASNENPLGPSPKAAAALRKSAGASNRYPDSSSGRLRGALAKKHGVNPASVILGAGSDELIEILGKTFLEPGDDIVVSAHAFIRYKMAGDLMGCRVKTVPMLDDKHDLQAMARAAGGRTKFIFVANPNNPTGTYNTDSELRKFLAVVRRRTFVVLDEAYYEFAAASVSGRRLCPDYPDSMKYLRRSPGVRSGRPAGFGGQGDNIIILRTFSKIYGLAGLRVGYGFAHPDVVGWMDRVRPPFNVSTAAQAAAGAALSDSAHIKRSIAMNAREMKRVVDGLAALGIACLPSAGNFLLADVSPRGGSEIFRKLLRLGVIVRPVDEYGYPRHIRVSVGLPSENAKFLAVLKKCI